MFAGADKPSLANKGASTGNTVKILKPIARTWFKRIAKFFIKDFYILSLDIFLAMIIIARGQITMQATRIIIGKETRRTGASSCHFIAITTPVITAIIDKPKTTAKTLGLQQKCKKLFMTIK